MTIEVKNVSKRYNSKQLVESEEKNVLALKNINLTFETGKFTCLIGPSGCGKTTLLRMIEGFEQPTEGEILDEGIIIDKPSKKRGFIFQQYSLFPWLNVIDNVTFGLKISGQPRKENNERALKYLDAVGLKDFAKSYPHELSGGMKQRVAIIRSVINDSKMLLMDEPFSALDMQTKRSLQEQLVNNWQSKTRTIIFVTHDVDEAVFLSDKIVVFSKRPGEIRKIIQNDLPRPRKRESREYLDLQNETMKCIDKHNEVIN